MENTMNKTFFLAKNHRDPLSMIDIFNRYKNERLNEIKTDVWATIHIDFFDDRADGISSAIQENEEVECVIITKDRFDKMQELCNETQPMSVVES